MRRCPLHGSRSGDDVRESEGGTRLSRSRTHRMDVRGWCHVVPHALHVEGDSCMLHHMSMPCGKVRLGRSESRQGSLNTLATPSLPMTSTACANRATPASAILAMSQLRDSSTFCDFMSPCTTCTACCSIGADDEVWTYTSITSREAQHTLNRNVHLRRLSPAEGVTKVRTRVSGFYGVESAGMQGANGTPQVSAGSGGRAQCPAQSDGRRCTRRAAARHHRLAAARHGCGVMSPPACMSLWQPSSGR